jgi:cytochrome b561
MSTTRPLTTTSRYNRVAILLHWLIAFLIIGQLIGGKVMMALDFSDFKVSLYQWHKAFGITILTLAVLRLLWRLTHRAPALPADIPGWQKTASHISHAALYGFMIGVPLLGWLLVSASPKGFPTTWFNLFPIPNLPVAASKESAELFTTLHEITAFGFAALILLHIGAALHHHFGRKDDILRRMLPARKPRS